MSQVSITNHLVSNLRLNGTIYCLKDTNLQGFGVKVNKSGSIKYIAEVWHKGRSRRKDLRYLSIADCSTLSFVFVRQISGSLRRIQLPEFLWVQPSPPSQILFIAIEA